MWLVRTDTIDADGRLKRDVPPVTTTIGLRGFARGEYCATFWDTRTGRSSGTALVRHDAREYLKLSVSPVADIAIAIRAERSQLEPECLLREAKVAPVFRDMHIDRTLG